MDELPTEYDTIVVGTGLPESILAAAHARNGRSVLHIDRNDYYGGMWSTFNFDALERWLRQLEKPEEIALDLGLPWDTESFLKDGESVIPCSYRRNLYTNLKKYQYVCQEESNYILPPEEIGGVEKCQKIDADDKCISAKVDKVDTGTEDAQINPIDTYENSDGMLEKSCESSLKTSCSAQEAKWTMTKIRSLYRKFNVDLAPKLLFSRGELVDLLISSNIARYSEFKSVTRVLTRLEGKLEQVPCSRSDVFTTKNVSIVEKRMLMKLLTFCLNYEESPDDYIAFENKPFVEFLKSRKLTSNVQHYVLHAIAMVPESASTIQGLQSTKRFLNSLGRFGNTPFLWPLYGSGELPQCFCRLCAVFGGLYHLKRGVEAVIINEDNVCCGIMSNGKRFNCKWLVMEANFAPSYWLPNDYGLSSVSRAILFTSQSILPAEKEQLTLLRLPAINGLKEAVWVIELGPNSMACPPDIFVVHLTCKKNDDAKTDLKPVIDLLFDTPNPELETHAGDISSKPIVLWCLYFNQMDNSTLDILSGSNCPINVTLTAGPSELVDFDGAVHQAKTAFQRTFPEEEFLPRAPDPEDIIIEGSDEVPATTQPTGEGGPSDEFTLTIAPETINNVNDIAAPSLCDGPSNQDSCDEQAAQLMANMAIQKEE